MSTVYKEKGDMFKEAFDTDKAMDSYEQGIRLRKKALDLETNANFSVEKMYFRMADCLMRDRGNEHMLKKA